MKVYLVIRSEVDEGDTVAGVFLNEDSTEAHAHQREAEENSSYINFYVDEWHVNE